jgi:hypothetical protein
MSRLAEAAALAGMQSRVVATTNVTLLIFENPDGFSDPAP